MKWEIKVENGNEIIVATFRTKDAFVRNAHFVAECICDYLNGENFFSLSESASRCKAEIAFFSAEDIPADFNAEEYPTHVFSRLSGDVQRSHLFIA